MVKCASVSVHRPGARPAIYQSETSIWRWQGRARKRWRPSRRAQCAARAGQSLSIRWGSSFLASEYGLSASTRRLQPRRKPTTCFQVLCGAFLCFSVGYLTVGLSGQAVFFCFDLPVIAMPRAQRAGGSSSCNQKNTPISTPSPQRDADRRLHPDTSSTTVLPFTNKGGERGAPAARCQVLFCDG